MLGGLSYKQGFTRERQLADGQGQKQEEPGMADYAAVGFAWLVPGAGHLLIGERGRGILFLVTIHLLFGAGLFIGGIRAINPSDQPIWSVTQFLSGWPMIVANVAEKHLEGEGDLPVDYAPAVRDIGSVYCGIAGMLNMLVMFDVLIRVSGGRRSGSESTEHKRGSPGGA